MTGYRTFRTTMGRKYAVRMTAEEQDERFLYNAALVALPFITSIAFFLIWVKMG